MKCVFLCVVVPSNFYGYVKTSSNAIPPPPPMPPPPPSPPSPPAPVVMPNRSDTLKSTKSGGSGVSNEDGVQEELKAVLTLYRDRKPAFDIKKTPDLFIQQTSNPIEVQKWLEGKGFDTTVQKKLKIPGHELFLLSKKQLEMLIGPEEGKRLYSQILVQRNVSGYKTTSASELQSILRKVREKVEIPNGT